jgi:hypothetical protein
MNRTLDRRCLMKTAGVVALATAAAGLIGGLAAGTIIGAAVAAPRYYGPPPVYVAPAPYCYWTQGQPVWDPYRGAWMYPAVRVCQ